MYTQVSNDIKAFLTERRDELIIRLKVPNSELDPRADAAILRSVARDWETLQLSIRMLSDVLMYLDRAYVRESGLPPVYEVGATIFREIVLEALDAKVVDLLSQIILRQIRRARKGETVSLDDVRWLLTLLLDSKNAAGESVYTTCFEPLFIKETEQYYSTVAKDLLSNENGAFYLQGIAHALDKEERLLRLDIPASKEQGIDLVQRILVKDNLSSAMFFSEGLEFWIAERTPELALVRKITTGSAQPILKGALTTCVEQQVSSIPIEQGGKESASQKAVRWLTAIALLRKKYSAICSENFEADVELTDSIEAAFSGILNKQPSFAEYLSLFIDSHIKKASDKTENALDAAVDLFRLVRDKDLFERQYRAHLAKRVLQLRLALISLERSMVARLRDDTGPTFTSKLEGMLKDVSVSQDLGKEFKGTDITFEARVLTATFWPFQNSAEVVDIIYPEVFKKQMVNFEKFYIEKHKGRVLSWAPMRGLASLRMRYGKRMYEASMLTYAAMVLLLFEEHDSLTFSEIAQLTQIPKHELVRHVQSVSVAPKTRLLRKLPMSREISDDHSFCINEKFEAPTSKFRVLTVALSREKAKEREKLEEDVEYSRRMEVDAAIVRIMKSRKRAEHNELMAEVIRQVGRRFSPLPAFIKTRIGSLIEREYLARGEDLSSYIYLA